MPDGVSERRWFWATLMLSSISIVAVVFAFWELVENNFFSDLNYVSLHYLYVSRGIVSSLLLSIWAAWFVLRQRRIYEEGLHRSRERYRGLLDASPAALVLFDKGRRVGEWNAAAENLYGYSKAEVLGHPLPTVPLEKEGEMESFMRQVEAGERVIEEESVRTGANGQRIEVQVSLLPYDEGCDRYFLEVSSDNRERVKLRQTLLEIEKLTSIGMMAAGTAHHLNTPLATMLLRTQMLRDRISEGDVAQELGRLETNISFCQQFVRRLLDFSRRPELRKQPEEVAEIVEAVLGFMAPSLHAKGVNVTMELSSARGKCLFADRNELETMLLILISNALDAVAAGGDIKVSAVSGRNGTLELRVADNGCGIAPADMERIFQPFFTTKPPGKGTGLGLSMARNIATEHGGSITLSSELQRGTEVVVRLPIHSATKMQGASQ